jgi:hypothetical protein
MDWYDPAWTKAKKITVPSAQLGGAGSLTDIRVLVSVTDADVKAAAQADGDDILFADSDGTTKLDHELISYDNGTGAIFAWVRVPSVADASVDYEIWMYYGNAGCGAQENPDGVWKDSPTKAATAVWHFENDVLDASGNSNDGTDQGTVDVAGTAAAAGFSTVEVDTSVSIGAWVKAGASSARQTVIVKGNTGDEVLSLYIGDTGRLMFEDYHAGTYKHYAEGTTNLKDSAWHRVWGVRDGATMKVYVDGSDDTLDSDGGSDTTARTEDVYMGKRINDDYFLNADLDELWVLEGAMSAEEATADYNSTNDPASFMTFGSEISPVESSGQEMPMFILEGVVSDLEMPMSVLEGTADRTMWVTILEWLYSDQEMPFIQPPEVEISSDQEIPLILLEHLEVDPDVPTTLLEWLKQELEPQLPILEEVQSDQEMTVHQSQDRADDREMPVTLLEGLNFDQEPQVPIMESVTADPDVPVSLAQGVAAGEEMDFDILQGVNADEEMGFSQPDQDAVSDQEMPTFVLQGVYGDNDMPGTILQGLHFDEEAGASWTEAVTPQDEEIPATLLEHILAEAGLPVSLEDAVRNDEEPCVWILQGVDADRGLPAMWIEPVEGGGELPVLPVQGVGADGEMPATALKIVRFDREMMVSLEKEYAPTPVGNDQEMPAMFSQALRSESETPFFVVQGVRAKHEMPATLREFVVFAEEMPFDWWDEVKYVVIAGERRLENHTWEYDLVFLTEAQLEELMGAEAERR